MKKIIKNGLHSKNSPIYTIDSFKLTNSNKNIDGIIIDIYLTKDNTLVLLNEKVMKLNGINKQYVYNHTFDNLKKINFGNKIKQSRILSVEELLKFFKKKYIIVNLKDTDNYNRNCILVNNLLKIIKANQNISWFLTSNSLNMLNIINCQKK